MELTETIIAASIIIGVPSALLIRGLMRGEPLLPYCDPKIGITQRRLKDHSLNGLTAELKKDNTTPKATIIISSPNFGNIEWGAGTRWYEFLQRHLSQGGRVKAFAYMNKPLEHLKKLIGSGIQAFARPNYDRESYCLVDNPKQIWGRDTKGLHRVSIFTNKPTTEATGALSNYFQRLEQESVVVRG